MRLPSGENAALRTSTPDSLQRCQSRPVLRIPHRRAVPSSLAVTMRLPSGENAASLTGAECPLSVASKTPGAGVPDARRVIGAGGDDAFSIGREHGHIDRAAVMQYEVLERPSRTVLSACSAWSVGARSRPARRSGAPGRRSPPEDSLLLGHGGQFARFRRGLSRLGDPPLPNRSGQTDGEYQRGGDAGLLHAPTQTARAGPPRPRDVQCRPE
jgi:hypothetical protein